MITSKYIVACDFRAMMFFHWTLVHALDLQKEHSSGTRSGNLHGVLQFGVSNNPGALNNPISSLE